MSNRRHHADTWKARTTRRLDEIRTALLDLIDVGVPDTPTEARQPSKREKLATDRTDGEFRPTVRVTRRSTYSDPTGREVLSWEGEVQDATTRLYAAVTVATEVADGLDLHPHAETGTRLTPPVEPPTRETLTGRLVVDVSPAACRRAMLAGVTYIAAVADQVADRISDARGDAGEAVDDRAGWLEAAVGHLAFKLAPPPPPRDDGEEAPVATRPCRCDRDDICPHPPDECDNDVKVSTGAGKCGTCRNRLSASNRAAS